MVPDNSKAHRVAPYGSTVVGSGERKALGLFRAENMEELDRMLGALPMAEWMQTNVTPLEKHPHDPASSQAARPPF